MADQKYLEPGSSVPPDRPHAGGVSRGGRTTPFGVGISLGRWAGVDVRAHWSVAVVLLLLVDLLAAVVLPEAAPRHALWTYWVVGTVTAVVFLAALVAHELAHAVTARHYGMEVTSITLWMLGGLTELDGEPPSPRADALIALSGPATSFLVGGLSAGLAWTVNALAGGFGLAGTALGWLAGINLLLGAFNLLPGAPLDGGRLLRALLWRRTQDRAEAARKAATAGQVLGTVMVALGIYEVLFVDMGGLWLALLGWFIISGAASERYAVGAEKLSGLHVQDVMTRTPAVAPSWWSVEQFLDRLAPEDTGQPAFPLVDVDGQAAGVTTLSRLERVAPAQRPDVRLRELVRARTPPTVGEDAPLTDVYLAMHLRGDIAVVVAEHGAPVGVVTELDLARAAQLARLGWPHR